MKNLVYSSETYSPLKSKLYPRFFYITGFQIRQPFQIRNKIIYFLYWIFIKTHLFFLFRFVEFM